MLDLDPDAPRTPQMPTRRLGGLMQFAASVGVHTTFIVVVASAGIQSSAHGIESHKAEPSAEPQRLELRHVVFLAPKSPRTGGGGGGGGNQQQGPIRRAQGVGSDDITLRVRKTPQPPVIPVTTAFPLNVQEVPPLPSIVLEAKPMASGTFDQTGLPTSDGPVSGTSTGPGSGGGVGTGVGTGIGSGRGPGLGPGSGGGTGGGMYRPGGSVSAPRLLKEVKPAYTSGAALNRIEGAVALEVIVTADGRTSRIRVVKSLDPGGLDEEAAAAVAQWRFEPGRLAGVPVDVLVTIVIDFWIR